LKETIVINEKEPSRDILDFKYLKELALEQLQKLSGKLWTDFNTHDPGITILEILCFAATEQGYRSGYSVRDLLAHPPPDTDEYETLIGSAEILSSGCVTINDYRRLLLDIEGIRNALLRPANEYPDFKGIYNVYLELLPDYNTEFARKAIVEAVRLLLFNNRNLCEDFNEISFFEYDPIGLELNIEIYKDANITEVLGNIFYVLQEYVSPTATFYSLDELLEQNYPVDKIFNGPLLKNGFLLEEDLKDLETRENLYTSDLIHSLMDIKGVNFIKNILFLDSDDNVSQWLCKVKDNKTPQLDLERIQINFYNQDKKLNLDFDYEFYFEKALKHEREKSGHKKLEFKRESGTYRNLNKYDTIQNNFPEVYGIGEVGLHPSAPEDRKAKARQLKGYLLIFDQVIANFFSQLDNLHNLFSSGDIKKTYFSQPLFDIPGIEYLYKPFTDHCFAYNININDTLTIRKEWTKFKKENHRFFQTRLDEIIETEDTFILRRNKILSHLLARFALAIDDILFFEHDSHQSDLNFTGVKSDLLNNIVRFTKQRFIGRNYPDNKYSGSNTNSGFEFNFNLLMNVDQTSRVYNEINLKDLVGIKNLADNGIIFTREENKLSEDFFFINVPEDEIVRYLFKYGSFKENYFTEFIKTNKVYIVNLRCPVKDVKIRLKRVFSSLHDAQKAIDRINQTIIALNRQCESIQLIEHILLRPSGNLSLFGFIINDKTGTPLFNSETWVSADERKRIIDDIFSLGKDSANYKVIYEGIKQYKLVIFNPDGMPLLKTMHYYESEESGFNDIKNLKSFIVEVATSAELRQQRVKYYTKYSNIFHETADPYSFILTVLIPDWPEKYQNTRLKSFVEHMIYRDIPSHIMPLIKWVNMAEFYKFRSLYEDYLEERNKPYPDTEKMYLILDEFMQLISI
jgi:hypothetical protein